MQDDQVPQVHSDPPDVPAGVPPAMLPFGPPDRAGDVSLDVLPEQAFADQGNGPEQGPEQAPEQEPERLLDEVADETSDAAPARDPEALPQDLNRTVADLLNGPQSGAPRMLMRLYKAFESQVDQVEARLKALVSEVDETGNTDMVEIDRTVKTLSSLAKTLGLLLELKKSTEEADASRKESEERRDVTADPDALRQELARRLGKIGKGRRARSGTGDADL
ncbi:MAG: hypothetical protein HWE23_01540 [Rhodobacteraceae bacterium]|nr:hypothetical protein [Paracoccaceae bacterium]